MSMQESIDGFTMRNILSNAKDLLPAKIYEKGLADSNMLRFKDELPAPDPTKVATATELTAFWRSLYEQVSFPIFKLFQRNIGGQIADMSQTTPGTKPARERITALPREQRLAEAVKYTSELINMGGAQTSYRPHGQGYLLYFDNCPFVCRQIQSSQPLCHLYEYMFLKVLKGFSQLPLISEEIECIATGGSACRYLFKEAAADLVNTASL